MWSKKKENLGKVIKPISYNKKYYDNNIYDTKYLKYKIKNMICCTQDEYNKLQIENKVNKRKLYVIL